MIALIIRDQRQLGLYEAGQIGKRLAGMDEQRKGGDVLPVTVKIDGAQR